MIISLLSTLHLIPSPMTSSFLHTPANRFLWPQPTWQTCLPDNHAFKVSWRSFVELSPSSYSFLVQHDKAGAHFEGNNVIVQSSFIEPNPLDTFFHYLLSWDFHFPTHPQPWAPWCFHATSWLVSWASSPFPLLLNWRLLHVHHGATFPAAAGVPASQTQAIGGWHSTTFKQYIQHHPIVLQALIFHGCAIHDLPFAAL